MEKQDKTTEEICNRLRHYVLTESAYKQNLALYSRREVKTNRVTPVQALTELLEEFKIRNKGINNNDQN